MIEETEIVSYHRLTLMREKSQACTVADSNIGQQRTLKLLVYALYKQYKQDKTKRVLRRSPIPDYSRWKLF